MLLTDLEYSTADNARKSRGDLSCGASWACRCWAKRESGKEDENPSEDCGGRLIIKVTDRDVKTWHMRVKFSHEE